MNNNNNGTNDLDPFQREEHYAFHNLSETTTMMTTMMTIKTHLLSQEPFWI